MIINQRITVLFFKAIRMQDFPHIEIRRAALVAYGELLILVHKLKHNLGKFSFSLIKRLVQLCIHFTSALL